MISLLKSSLLIAFFSTIFVGLAFAATDDSEENLNLLHTMLPFIPGPKPLLYKNDDLKNEEYKDETNLLNKVTDYNYDATSAKELLKREFFTSIYFWQTMLPNTPMPRPLRHALVSMNADDKEEAYDGQKTLSEITSNCLSWYDKAAAPELLQQDSVTSLFVLEKDMIPGTKLNIHFTSQMQGPAFPSYRFARKMPALTSRNLPQLLQFFSVSPNSKPAKSMTHTVSMCEGSNLINGRVQFCAVSVESMVTRVTSELKNSQNLKAVSMPTVDSDSLMLYKISDVQQLAAERSMIVCHKYSFPVGIYYCHQPRGVMAYKVSLVRQQDNAQIYTYAICHYHTSGWNPGFIALKALGILPGTSFCHFIESDMVIWYNANLEANV